jgi:hypothetical protein
MVRAILEGRKTQTRRVVKPQPVGKQRVVEGLAHVTRGMNPADDGSVWYVGDCADPGTEIRCPFGVPGDGLWVREAHITGWPCELGELQQFDEDGNELPKHCWYKATPDTDGGYISNLGERICVWHDENETQLDRIPWGSPLYMPRKHSRITLEVTGVRVERLNAISEEDARAEGCGILLNDDLDKSVGARAQDQFSRLWNSIHGEGSWAANPWVWVVEFRKVEA